jgi:hypothetical protein
MTNGTSVSRTDVFRIASRSNVVAFGARHAATTPITT